MKKVLTIIFSIIITLAFMGCGKKENYKDMYIEGTDYQYMFQNIDRFTPEQAKGKNGYYMLWENYIYCINKENKTISVVCGKPDCLHQLETNKERCKECNGYVNSADNAAVPVGISCYDGNLFFITEESTDNMENNFKLYRLSEDGTEKEVIKSWDKSTVIEQWIIHRGRLYYVEESYVKNKDTHITKSLKLKSILLDHPKEETTIYIPKKDLAIDFVGWIQAYGKHLYFEVEGYTTDKDIVTNDNYEKYLYMKTYEYDLETKIQHEIQPKDGGYVQRVTFWNGKLLTHPWKAHQDYGSESAYYLTELDGTNPVLYKKDGKFGEQSFSDGKYLYINNSLLLLDKDATEIYQVYDKDLNLVDTMKFPFRGFGNPPIGDQDLMLFTIQENENENVCDIEYLDKNNIGKHNGEIFKLENLNSINYYPLEEDEE